MLTILLSVFTSLVVSCDSGTKHTTYPEPYLDRLATFETNLLVRSPAPQDWEDDPLPNDTEEVRYRSGDLSLRAWVHIPDANKNAKHPTLIYFHGGFGFGQGDLEVCQPFINAGYVIMCPMLRGENGNAGAYELFFGEVEDAKAAAHWIAHQPYVDTERIYAFGHSIGGGISALLSLRQNVPVRHTASSGGLYGPELFIDWSDIVPFDLNNGEERSMRTLVGNVAHMQFPHYAYLGTEDLAFEDWQEQAERESKSGGGKLNIVPIAGDHFTSLAPALRAYLELTEKDKKDGNTDS